MAVDSFPTHFPNKGRVGLQVAQRRLPLRSDLPPQLLRVPKSGFADKIRHWRLSAKTWRGAACYRRRTQQDMPQGRDNPAPVPRKGDLRAGTKSSG